MKKLLSLLSVFTFFIGSFGPAVFAADTTQKIHHFTIIAPPTTKVGQAIDIKVEARDKDDKIIPSYNGSVYFQSTTDFGATLPAQGKSVQFKTSDNGAITISKAIIFKRVGSQTLTVTETIEDADGSVTIKVDPADDTTGSGSTAAESITIITPDNNSTITSDTVTVSGKTRKNSKVSIKLNGKEVATVLSDDTGIYTKSLTDITQTNNILSASVLDGNNTVMATAESKFGVATDGPEIIGTSVNPASVTTGDTLTITTEADPGLSDVSFILDGSSIKATEKSSGKYSADTVAPAKAGTYPIGITAKSSLGKTTSNNNAATLTVAEKAAAPSASFNGVKLTTEGTKVLFQFSVENTPTELGKFKIAYGESPDNLSSEVMTFDALKIQGTGGIYTWYIDKLPPKEYTFKIFGAKADGSLIGGLTSESLSATVGQPGCTIGNVGKINVLTNKDTSTLSWDALTGAVSYNLYKVTPAGDYELVQNTKETQYTLFLSSGSLVYENFALKALCDDKNESSAKPALASKVQTGPGAVAVLVIFSALASLFFFRRKFI